VTEAKIGIIGGSGLYDLEGISDLTEVRLSTPFGDPSDVITLGTFAGQRVAFLPRHGRGHRLLPSELPNRANIYALKVLGVERIIAVSAVGSMRETIHPLDLVVPDQIVDRTTRRPNTFFGEGLVAHISFADPFCPQLSALLAQAAEETGARVHRGGTYICIEGPQFSTRAESRIYRQWGVDIIGMTAVPEAKLAREAEICYAVLALVTDYDVWHVSEQPVTAEMVIANLQRNVAQAKRVLATLIPRLGVERTCACGQALRDALVTDLALIPPARREALRPLIGRYLERRG
jgi:5'-methylthioadenosine phosphorylase